MIRNVARDQRSDGRGMLEGRQRQRQRRWMRPTVMALEDRRLLSTFTVTNTADSGTGSLRSEIGLANSTAGNNTITFSVTGTITLNSALPDLSNTTGLMDIDGPGASSLTVARSSAPSTSLFSIFTVSAGAQVAISGLTVTGGDTTGDGGGLYNDGGTATLTGIAVVGNSAAAGGGLFNFNGTITLTNSTVNGNSASNSGDTGVTHGGGIDNNGFLTATGDAFSHDDAFGAGGGIFNEVGGMVTLTSCTFSNDTGGTGPIGGAGGLANYAIMTVDGCTFSDNLAPFGGGLYNGGATSLTVDDSTFSDNSASVYGGGIENEGGTLTVDGSTFSGNSASQGGGLDDVFGGSVMVDGSTFSGNSASQGAGLYVGAASTATLTNFTIAGNTAGSTGGGIGNSARPDRHQFHPQRQLGRRRQRHRQLRHADAHQFHPQR